MKWQTRKARAGSDDDDDENNDEDREVDFAFKISSQRDIYMCNLFSQLYEHVYDINYTTLHDSHTYTQIRSRSFRSRLRLNRARLGTTTPVCRRRKPTTSVSA